MTTSERKSRKIYYTMGEVSEMFDVNPSLIRFWEQKFDILKPDKNKKGNRLFTPKDVENLKLIYHLVKENGMTLAGAAKRLRQNREGVSRDLEIIEKLQRDGFLECSRKTDDRRSVFLHITKKGEEALVQWEETCVRLEEEMLQGFDRSEQDQFYDFLLRAYDNLSEGKGDEQGA